MRTDRSSVVMTLLCPGASVKTEAKAFGVAIALLIISGEFTFRSRSAALALSGNADSQILIELLISAAIGGWLIIRRIMGQAAGSRTLIPYRRLARTSPLRVFRFIALFAVVSSFWSTTTIAPVRAFQLVVVVELFADAVMSLRSNRAALHSLFTALARTLIWAVVIAGVITLVGPGFSPYFPTYNGPSRLRLLAMHPIATADLFAFVALLVAAPLWRLTAERPERLGRRRGSWRRVASCLALVVLMIMTLERTSAVAGLVALAVLLFITLEWGIFRLLALAFVAAVLAAAPILGSGFLSFAARGETSTGITSLSGRNQIFDLARQLFWERPFTGWGYNAGRSIFLPTIPWAGESHNVIVEIAVSGGMVALCSYAALLGLWVRQAVRALRVPGAPRQAAALSVALVVLVSIVGIGSDSFAGPPKLLVIALGFALMLADLAVELSEPTPGTHAAQTFSGDAPATLGRRPSCSESGMPATTAQLR